MKDIAIYKSTNTNKITVYTFSENASNMVLEVLGDIKFVMSTGNKPGSIKFKISCSKDHMNELLNG